MCIKCGGCKAYANLSTCLFCEDGEPCPCGGWAKLVAAEVATRKKKTIARPKGEPKTIARPKGEPLRAVQTAATTRMPHGTAGEGAEQAKQLRGISPVAEISGALKAAPEVRSRWGAGFLQRRMREFYGAGR